MTKDEAIAAVDRAFSDVPRPATFVRDTCDCEECAEHGQTLSAFTPDTIGIEQLGNPGWDPISFANDQGFAYYLPGMIRLAFGDDYYVDQLLLHLTSSVRPGPISERQAAALCCALETLLDTDGQRIRINLDEDDLMEALDKLKGMLG